MRRSPGGPLFAILAVAAVAGCATGPDSKAPELPSVTRYTSPAEVAEPNPDAATNAVPPQKLALGEQVRADWWTLFRSQDLDVLVKQAVAGSHTLESARARLVAQREAVTAARGALYPQVSLNAELAREKQSSASFGLPASAFPLPPNYNLLQVGPTASYTLDLFGDVRHRIEQQAALAELQRDQLAAAYMTLTGNTVFYAVQIAAIRSQVKAVSDIVDIDRQTVDLVQKERQVGEVPDTDVISAESQLAADETLQPGLDQQLSVAQHALAVLLGRAPADWSPPDFDLSGLTLPDRLPVSLPSQLAHRRPDILAAEAQLRGASAQIGIATAQLYPSITLSAGISGSSLNGSNLFDPATLAWSIAAGLTQPVFDGGMRRAQRRAALAAFRESAADYQQTVLEAFRQVADILQALTHDTSLLGAQKRALDMASQSVNLQRISYEKGGSGILQLLDAQRLYQRALLGYVQAEAQRYLDTVQLQVAMGGGWWGADLGSKDVSTYSPAPSH